MEKKSLHFTREKKAGTNDGANRVSGGSPMTLMQWPCKTARSGDCIVRVHCSTLYLQLYQLLSMRSVAGEGQSRPRHLPAYTGVESGAGRARP